MIPLKFGYLFFCLLFFIPWVALFWHRKDIRRAMLIMGLIAAIGSFLTSYYWTIDWWLPENITGTRMGVEDYILGISNGGIATVLYVEIFHKRLYHFSKGNQSGPIIALSATACFVFWTCFELLNLSSFYSCILALFAYCSVLAYLRKELVLPSVINGILMVMIAIPIYLLTIFMFPDFVTKTYVYPLATQATLFTVPLQEFIFYFAFGLMVPLMYEYWHGVRLRRLAVPARSKRN
jgi:hypothetical protein